MVDVLPDFVPLVFLSDTPPHFFFFFLSQHDALCFLSCAQFQIIPEHALGELVA